MNIRITHMLGWLFAFCLSVVFVDGENQPRTYEGDWLVAKQIEQRIEVPNFPDRRYSIDDFGADKNGGVLSTDAIRRAIENCNREGGGVVLVPKGDYLTGPIRLLSNVNLHLEEGATLRFTTDSSQYLPPVHTRWEGVECYNYSPLVYAFKEENVAITGEGTLDGQADWDNWWAWNKKRDENGNRLKTLQTEARNRLFAQAENGVPVAERKFGEGDYLRPNFVQIYLCENVLVEGVTLKRSPMWEIHPVLCRNVTVRGITVISHGPNNDGCNPESCKDVLIENCLFDTGDDCIAIKSGRNWDGRRINVPSENIIVRDCAMKEGHGGVVIGSEISGGCRNVFIEDCQMDSPNLDRALRIKTNSIRGGLIENVYARNISVGQVKDAVIKVNFHYEEGDAGKYTPLVKNIVVQNLFSRKSPRALDLRGYGHSPIRDIKLIDCRFEGVEKADVLINVENLILDRVDMNTGSKYDQFGNPL